MRYRTNWTFLVPAVLVISCASMESRWQAAESVKQRPVPISQTVQTEYPEAARDAGLEGRVLLRLLVGKDGRVEDVRFVEGHPVFKEAAMVSARQRLFVPVMQKGKPVRSTTLLVVEFVLSPSDSVDIEIEAVDFMEW